MTAESRASAVLTALAPILGVAAVLVASFGSLIVVAVAIANGDLAGWLFFVVYCLAVWGLPLLWASTSQSPTQRRHRLAVSSATVLAVHLIAAPAFVAVLAM